MMNTLLHRLWMKILYTFGLRDQSKRPKGRWVAVGPIIGNRRGARQRMRWMTVEEAHKYETRTPMPPPGPGGYKR